VGRRMLLTRLFSQSVDRGSARSTIARLGWWGTRADPPLHQRLSSFLALAAGAGASEQPLSCVSFTQVGELPESKPPPETPSRHRSFPARIWRRGYIIDCAQRRDAILNTTTWNSLEHSWTTPSRSGRWCLSPQARHQ
jgi:hypothetical protein